MVLNVILSFYSNPFFQSAEEGETQLKEQLTTDEKAKRTLTDMKEAKEKREKRKRKIEKDEESSSSESETEGETKKAKKNETKEDKEPGDMEITEVKKEASVKPKIDIWKKRYVAL